VQAREVDKGKAALRSANSLFGLRPALRLFTASRAAHNPIRGLKDGKVLNACRAKRWRYGNLRVTGEPKHWIEYGCSHSSLSPQSRPTAAWYTRRESETAAENGRRQLRAYVFPDQANLILEGTAKPTLAEIVIKNSGQTPRIPPIDRDGCRSGRLSTSGRSAPCPDADNHTVVPPTASYSLSVPMAQPLTGDQLKAIQKELRPSMPLARSPTSMPLANAGFTRYRFYYRGQAEISGAGLVSLTRRGQYRGPVLQAQMNSPYVS